MIFGGFWVILSCPLSFAWSLDGVIFSFGEILVLLQQVKNHL